jgi:hypothetical protein
VIACTCTCQRWLRLIIPSDLTGTLPASVGEMTALYMIDFGSNQLSGELPASLFGLSELRLLFLDENRLSGTIPPRIGALVNLGRCSRM